MFRRIRTDRGRAPLAIALCCGVVSLIGHAVLQPRTTELSDIRIRSELLVLLESARSWHWSVAWIPAVRHAALSEEFCRREAIRRASATPPDEEPADCVLASTP
ncbi:MAG: hypothetical protein RBS39_06280 [Phycisphaerales bacterium]|jgi:hypothetical protein|nr:hypothetical protein [Phycisphaerales bacterium]